jgi:hypothetical protein
MNHEKVYRVVGILLGLILLLPPALKGLGLLT